MWVNDVIQRGDRRDAGSESGLSGKERSLHHWGDRGVWFVLVVSIKSLNKYKSKQKTCRLK